jgi:exopolysaccharide biosynthesis polyprenyl glycosylphosphotransferase
MLRRFSVNFALFSMVLDAILIFASLYAAIHIRPFLNVFPFTADIDQPTQVPGLLYPLFSAIWVGIFLLLSVYDSRRNLRVVDEFTSLTLASILAGVSLAGMLYFSYRDVSRALFLTFVLLSYVGLLSWRSGSRLAFRLLNGKAQSHRRVLIVGAGPVGRQLQKKIVQSPYLGLKVAGFLDDDPDKRRGHSDILGSLEEAHGIIKRSPIDDVVIALPQRAHKRVNALVAELHTLPVKVWVIPDYFHLALHKAVIEEFAGIPMLDLRAPALNDYQRMVKRIFDLVLAFLALPPSITLMGLIALVIHLEDRGPVIFRQQRVGENGRLFEMLKFRTMVPGAEEMRFLVEYKDDSGHLVHKTPSDPRVTRAGRFLRRTSLDELPQLFNVIRGDMSLIGPRPEMPYLVDQYEPWQRQRFVVPQGITGWWQVNGRSDKPMHLHTEDDLYYVQNYSLWLDFQILLKTIAVVLRGNGAY